MRRKQVIAVKLRRQDERKGDEVKRAGNVKSK